MTLVTTTRSSGRALRDLEAFESRRDAILARGGLSGIGISTCLEPGGGNNIFEYLFNPKLQITTFVESVLIKVEPTGAITAVMCTTTSGQGHETLVSTIAGEELERDPDMIRVTRSDSLEALPTRSPVASRMAIVLGTATSNAAREILDKMITIAAHDLGEDRENIEYSDGVFSVRGPSGRALSWEEVAHIAHKQFHRMPPNHELGLQAIAVQQVPGGGQLPDEEQKVALYPCFSFQAHVSLVEIDPATGKVRILDYVVAHDSGTAINPDIVRGMMIGGVAHGIGAALYEKFEYGRQRSAARRNVCGLPASVCSRNPARDRHPTQYTFAHDITWAKGHRRRRLSRCTRGNCVGCQ